MVPVAKNPHNIVAGVTGGRSAVDGLTHYVLLQQAPLTEMNIILSSSLSPGGGGGGGAAMTKIQNKKSKNGSKMA